jgi:hypothetical protein
VLFAEEKVEVTSTAATAMPTISPAVAPTATPIPSSVNETNETAAVGESKGKGKGKGIFGPLIYVVIGIGIVIASLFLYNKFLSNKIGKRRQSRKERKEGEDGKPSAEVSGVQKGKRKEWY